MYYFYMWDSDHKLHPSGRTKGLCIIKTLSAPSLVRQLVGPFARIALLLRMLSFGTKLRKSCLQSVFARKPKKYLPEELHPLLETVERARAWESAATKSSSWLSLVQLGDLGQVAYISEWVFICKVRLIISKCWCNAYGRWCIWSSECAQ